MRHAWMAVLLILLSQQAIAQPTLESGGRIYRDLVVCFYDYEIDNPYSGFKSRPFSCEPVTPETRSPSRPSAYFLMTDALIALSHGVYMRHQYAFDQRPRVPMIRWPAAPAATLYLPPVGDGESLSLIVGESPESRATVQPLGQSREVKVAPRVPIVIAKVRENRPVALSDPLRLRAGGDCRATALDGEGVIMRTLLPAELGDRSRLRMATENLSPPRIVLHASDGRRHQPEWMPTSAGNLNGMILYFRDVAPGPAAIRIDGTGWTTATVTAEISAGVTVLEQPVTLAPAGTR